MADCGLLLPCESTVSSDSDALTITNSGGGAAIAAIATGSFATALKAEGTSGPGMVATSEDDSGITAVSNSNHGVRALSTSGYAVFASVMGTSGFSPPPSGVFGDSNTSYGVVGSSANSIGVLGKSDTDDGVVGISTTDVGVIGSSDGGDNSFAPFGVVGNCGPGTGVWGFSNSVRGVTGVVDSGTGVLGTALAEGTGVAGRSPSGTGVNGTSSGGIVSAGVFGTSSGGFISIGTAGISDSSTGIGIYGRGGEDGLAGLFDGSVTVNGFLTKSGGGFKIDHPLDPENKYLYHSFVEPPEMKNVYDGVVVLDNNGEYSVELSEWFEPLNCNFRYQLTSIGEPAPNLHVAQEIANNRFRIAGGKPGLKVSWQVTGIRKDLWAQAHPLTVEEEKLVEERGYYQSPNFTISPQRIAHFGRETPNCYASWNNKTYPIHR